MSKAVHRYTGGTAVCLEPGWAQRPAAEPPALSGSPEKRVVLSGRAAASVGSLGSGVKAVGSRRTQAQRTRAAMATPTQDALEAEVYNNKMCDWIYTYKNTPISKIKTVQQN